MKGLHCKLEGLSLDPQSLHKIQAESQYWGKTKQVDPRNSLVNLSSLSVSSRFSETLCLNKYDGKR